MIRLRPLCSILLLTGAASIAAQAQTAAPSMMSMPHVAMDATPHGRTRAETLAELEAARRSGDLIAAGESGLKLNELFPQLYPHRAPPPGKARAEVQAELAEAQRNGDIVASGESGATLRDLQPQLYPTAPVVAGKSRAQVRAELAEAIRTGDILASGESGITRRQLTPGRYPAREEATYAAMPTRTAHTMR